MTYNEWRDELKNNLLCVTDAERRRVLDYYAEAYADRREAGFTEREIIDDFGAPYDAAQRILNESSDEYYHHEPSQKSRNESKEKRNYTPYEEKRNEEREIFYEQQEKEQRTSKEKPVKQNSREDYTWVFVLLCVIFAAPLFGLVMTMVGITIGLCLTPFTVLLSGIASVVVGIATMFTEAAAGAITLGTGIIVMGVGVMLFPLFFKLVKWMWKLFTMFFNWLRRLFSGKEKTQ